MAKVKKKTTTRKRARTAKGRYKADNPATPNINEAYETTKVTIKKAAKKPAARKKPKIDPTPQPLSVADWIFVGLFIAGVIYLLIEAN